jgi:hypothetical protein
VGESESDLSHSQVTLQIWLSAQLQYTIPIRLLRFVQVGGSFYGMHTRRAYPGGDGFSEPLPLSLSLSLYLCLSAVSHGDGVLSSALASWRVPVDVNDDYVGE